MMNKINYFALLFLLVTGLCIFSCTKQDDFKKYTEGGEIVYPGRVDSLLVRGGNHRILLRAALASDPSVNRIKAYWNSRADSAEITFVRQNVNDTIDLLIPNLREGVYNFEVYTFNSSNNKSVVKNVSGSVYGDIYSGTLANRSILSLTQGTTANLFINWREPMVGEKSIEINYKDSNGIDRVLNVSGGVLQTEIPDFLDGSVLSYRSVFIPEENAYDTFVKDYSTVTLPIFERQLNKSLFNEVVLPTDVKEGGYNWLMPFLWNENYGTPGFATKNGTDQWFTFDTGVSTKISRFKVWMASDRQFKGESVKEFEIWGTDTPNADGSFSSWTKLMTCVSNKPSGSPVGTNTAADVAYANAGEEFILPSTVPKTRYIRIKVLSTYGNTAFITFGEFTFYTHDR